MNWFTKTYASNMNESRKRALVDEWGGCKHVAKDASLLHVVSYENDSFGKEGYCMCKECDAQMRAELDAEEVVCEDCGKTYVRCETISWRWYGFYAPQGDEPLVICASCQDGETHKKRLERYRHDAEADAEYDDEPDDMDYELPDD